MKIRPVGAELFRADGRTDRRTDMTKPIVAFCNFANAPKNSEGVHLEYLYIFSINSKMSTLQFYSVNLTRHLLKFASIKLIDFS
jgi:hypothetical protein